MFKEDSGFWQYFPTVFACLEPMLKGYKWSLSAGSDGCIILAAVRVGGGDVITIRVPFMTASSVGSRGDAERLAAHFFHELNLRAKELRAKNKKPSAPVAGGKKT
jgi:hypothetical protein